MTNEELNTLLYQKMFTEQEKYREWLLLAKVNVGSLISLGFMPSKSEKEYLQRNNEMILCLCGEHLRPYLYDKEYKVERLNHFQDKEQCTCCEKMGYDYRVIHIAPKWKYHEDASK